MFNKDGTLKKKHKIKIEEFMKDIKCRKDFLCCNKNLDELCEATIGGNWEYLRCDESPPVHCITSFTLVTHGYVNARYRNIVLCKCLLN